MTKKGNLFLAVLLLGAWSPINPKQLTQAYAEYNADVDALDILSPDYNGSEKFQRLMDDVPYIFVPLIHELDTSPSNSARACFVKKVSLLSQCVTRLSKLNEEHFPSTCKNLENSLSPDEVSLQEEYEFEHNLN